MSHCWSYSINCRHISAFNNIEIDILNDTKDKAPDPAVIETAEDEHKEVSKWTGRVRISIYLKLNKG